MSRSNLLRIAISYMYSSSYSNYIFAETVYIFPSFACHFHEASQDRTSSGIVEQLCLHVNSMNAISGYLQVLS